MATPYEVLQAVNLANAYLGLDLTPGDVMGAAEDFDWCAAISAHPDGDTFCGWVHYLIQDPSLIQDYFK